MNVSLKNTVRIKCQQYKSLKIIETIFSNKELRDDEQKNSTH